MKIDAHQHFWNYDSFPHHYVWMGENEAPLRRNFMPSDLGPLLRGAGFEGTIAVQAREMSVETSDLLALAAEHPIIKGVVGWLDLCCPFVEDDLDRHRGMPLLKGLRMLIHDRPDPDFAMSNAHVRGVSLLERYGLTYDLLIRPKHLPAAIRLVDRLPNQKFVVDHIAKPRVDGEVPAVWRRGMMAIAERPNVWCKLSGLGTLDGGPCDVTRFLDVVVGAFGADRCMIGSDWPVSTLAMDFQQTMKVVEDWCKSAHDGDRDAIFGGACAAFYGV